MCQILLDLRRDYKVDLFPQSLLLAQCFSKITPAAFADVRNEIKQQVKEIRHKQNW